MDLWHSAAFGVYTLFATGLCLMLVTIDGLGGGVRAGTKTTPNVEDATTTSKGATVVAADPDGVARVMRAHRNALANVVPFLLLMFLYVALGAPVSWVVALCGGFTAMRLLHAFAYIKAIQPWRSVSFTVGQVALVVTAVQVVRAGLALV